LGLEHRIRSSRRVWGLRLRRTEKELALALLLMLPTAAL